MDYLFRLTKYSHSFKIDKLTINAKNLITKFVQNWTQYDYVKTKDSKTLALEPKDIWTCVDQRQSEYRFHIGQLKSFLEFLQFSFVDESCYEVITIDRFDAKPAKLKVNKKFILREEQVKAENFLLQGLVEKDHSRLLAMPTGTGKTVTGSSAVAKIGDRLVIYLLPKYIKKWIGDFKEIYGVKDSRIVVVEGSKDLKTIIANGKAGDVDKDIIIVSMVTMDNAIRNYSENPSLFVDEYGIEPWEFCKTMGAGVVLIDEVHEGIGRVYNILAHTHVNYLIGLSATLLSMDSFVEKIQKMMLPVEMRFTEIKMKRYTTVYAISYTFRDYRNAKIKTQEYGSNMYSHSAFEKSILRQKRLLNDYLGLIDTIVQAGYIQGYQKGDKLAVYATSIAMCTEITNYLKAKYPRLDVRRYCDGDPYENVIDSDIRVTTIQSAGTAVDIPRLVTVIQTNSIQSPVSNLQMYGRLREIPDRSTRFYYMYCENVPKQVKYHRDKMELLYPKAKVIKEFAVRKPIG